MALTREADLMGTMPGMSLSPAETEQKAGKTCSLQPEPHALLSCPASHVCCTPPHVHVSNPPGPQASGSGPPKQEKQQINHFMLPSVSSRRGPSGPLSIMDPGLFHKRCTQRSTSALSLKAAHAPDSAGEFLASRTAKMVTF